ncbi:zinc finger 106 isoform X1 [Pelobates cultripes]|uniref:Zinc finger 106 isoform X1 n=1 Tax=Pelobates cultripes TaxID=61616 RepID=A0AAD1TNK2_PELCU|nr:zinc finger 106 isoform X1 [Pelobates cultripes]
MVRERKCILCHIVYTTKKEMDGHMRSMLHHRELENLRGRDCSHECRVCRVTVVGLSTYAKHISSQLHKDNVDAQEKEEEKDEDEEEYFDKELVQLINQRREQNRPDDSCCTSKEQEKDRYQRRREDHLLFKEGGPQDWHCDPSKRGWQWQSEGFTNSRQVNYQHPALNVNHRHLPDSRGRPGWHLNGPSNRHQNHGGGSWHSNTGGPTSWHHRGTGRNFHWHHDGNSSFPVLPPRNCVGNWQPNPYKGKPWNFGGNVDTFPQGRNRNLRHCDSTQEKDPGWNTTNCNKFSKERFTWKKTENSSSNRKTLLNSDTNSRKHEELSSDTLPQENVFESELLEKPSITSTVKPLVCPGKANNCSKDKPYRWTPYPSQKGVEIQQTLENDLLSEITEFSNNEPKKDQIENADRVNTMEDQVMPDICDKPEEDKAEQCEPKSPRMPSVKPPVFNVPDVKSSTSKRDQRNPLKGVKLQFTSSFGERQNRLSALNLETARSNSYISKLRSASRNTTKIIQEPQVSDQKEPVETLGDVLRKAKEMLQNSQSIQNPYFSFMKDASVGPDTLTPKVSNIVKDENQLTEDPLESGDDHPADSGAKLDNVLQSKCTSPFLRNCHLSEDNPGSIETYPEKNSTNTEHDMLPMQHTCKSFSTQTNTEALYDDSETAHQGQDDHESESLANVSDLELQKGVNQSSSPILPELSKLGLPASLQRDLTRHISSRSKTGTHLPEPNLNSARRIRNVSGHRKSETDKDSGLKPTLKQILNASRRNINWEQVIQHVTKKKQELGKGLPRFGIEMVAQVQSEQEGLDFDEETDLGIESFHWEGTVTGPLSARKRSLSESSVVVDKVSVYDIFDGHETHDERIPTSPSASGQNVNSMMLPAKQTSNRASITSPALNAAAMFDLPLAETSQSQKEDVQNCTTDSPSMFQSISEDVNFSAAQSFRVSTPVDVGTDSCTSGTEQYDGQGTGKKRRATGDCSCPEIPSLERNSKRRKIRARKERSQVDQLLSISLREEELNNSLLAMDNSLLQARAALQAAYMEVQHLLVQKQQITMEMSTLRTQRIQILQGLQGTYEPASDITEETNTSLPQAPVPPGNVFSFFLETPHYLSSNAPAASTALQTPARICTPPSFNSAPAVPDSSVAIKQERCTPEMREENMVTSPVRAVTSPEANGEAEQPTSVYPIITATMSLSELTSGFPLLNREESIDRPSNSDVQSLSQIHSTDNIKQNHSSSEVEVVSLQDHMHNETAPFVMSSQEANNCLASPPAEQQAESTLQIIETKIGKKKKKLRKKKTLRAAHVPDNSDTEQDTCSLKPLRKVRGRRYSKEATVSTSTSLEQDHEVTVQDAETNKGDNDSDSEVELVEIPTQQFEVVTIDSHFEDDKPDSPSKMNIVNSSKGHSEVYDEVTSTSELCTGYMDESMQDIVNNQGASLQSKNSSEVSSEPGDDEEPTEGRFEGHSASVNAIQIFSGLLYTCSADKTVHAYNIVTRQCVGVFEGHTSKVNCLLVTHTHGKSSMLFTGSSDHTVRCYSVKTQEFVEQLNLGERVLCLHARWKILYAGLANGTVVTFSLKNNKQLDVFECHGPRAVSSLATAQEGSRRLLLVGSYDCTISVRDARNGLLLRTLEGHTKTVLCMKVVNDLVFSGSSDQSVHAHNIHTGELIRIYKGHNHAVTVVNILGKVMVTACLDKFVRVYELQSHDRLQVYGGHSDMIMCMAIHKSMIYTGCYDGTVQAVRLNLMQNYRCWWHGCTLIFGVSEHLKQHLLTDHTNPNFQTLKCRWKNCDAFFTARRGSKQDAVGHIERHADEDSRLNM